MRYFIVADVHSHYDEMIKALNYVGFDKDNPEHIFCSLGDMFDRGEKTRECLKFVMSIPEERRILLWGNHEHLYMDIMRRNYFTGADEQNGTFKTCCHLANMSKYDPPEAIIREASHNQLMNKYLSELVNYYEIGDYILTHGYIPCFRQRRYNYETHKLEDEYTPFVYEWREASDEQWEMASWTCSYDAFRQGIKEKGKTIVAGHWHCSYGWHKSMGYPEHGKDACYDIYKTDGLIMLDACTALSHKVNVLVVED